MPIVLSVSSYPSEAAVPHRARHHVATGLPWIGMLGLLLAGCPGDPACTRNSDCLAGFYCSGGSCEQDCTPETVVDDCGEGASCNTFGMCVSPPDAGPRPDGGVDSGVDGGDPRPACVIGGGTDDDGDGYCAGPADDCNDDDGAVNPGAVDTCTDSAAAAAPMDENCDGVIDDGCSYFFGRPHWISDVAVTNEHQWFPRISADGLRMYTGALDQTRSGGPGYVPYVATRTSTSQRFGASVRVPGSFDAAGRHVAVMSPRADELEAFLQVDFSDGHREIYRTLRDDRAGPWGPPEVVIGTPGSWFHPAISDDGLTLYFVDVAGAPTLAYARRASLSAAFGSPSPVALPALPGASGFLSPWPLVDGSLLFVAEMSGGTTRVYRAIPDAGGSFTSAEELADLNEAADGFTQGVSYSETTRELFFSSNRAWSVGGGVAGIWRAEVCRDGACPVHRVDCAAGVRSVDQLHCYTLTATSETHGSAASACTAMSIGGRLASIHSAAEQTLLWSSFGATDQWRWIGLEENATTGVWTWEGGEVATYFNWYAGEPQPARNEPFATMAPPTGLWADWVNAPAMHRGICETEMWPTW